MRREDPHSHIMHTSVAVIATHSPIPVVSHPSTIVALAGEVGDSIVGDLVVFIDEHLKLTDTDSQV